MVDILAKYFKSGKSETKLQRGRDPVLGSFRLQNTTRVKVGKQGTNSTGQVKVEGYGVFRLRTPEQEKEEFPDELNSIIANQTSILDSNISTEPNQYDIRTGGRGSFFVNNFLDPVGTATGLAGAELNPIKSDSKNSKQFIKRKLEERSHLMFEFQTQEGSKRAFLPFSENLKITESQQSNLADYSLLSRNTQIFAYMGADSRSLKLSFSFKLLHILEMLSKEGIDAKFFKHHSDFNYGDNDYKTFVGLDITGAVDHAAIHRKYFNLKVFPSSYQQQIFDSQFGLSDFGMSRSNQSIKKVNDAINYIIYWINLVRSSVLNNSKNTVYGPPLVRLTHGPMYNAVPCITKSFNIEVDESAGYEAETLFPRAINVTMDLHETRIGDFSHFKSFDKIKGDNMSGWEAVFDENNMDPYNGLIGR